MNYGKQVRIQQNVDRMGLSIYVFENTPEGRFVYSSPAGMVRTKLTEGKQSEPALYIEDELAHELWLALDHMFGSEKSETASRELSATKSHLSDMKVIAFHKLGIRESGDAPTN